MVFWTALSPETKVSLIIDYQASKVKIIKTNMKFYVLNIIKVYIKNRKTQMEAHMRIYDKYCNAHLFIGQLHHWKQGYH